MHMPDIKSQKSYAAVVIAITVDSFSVTYLFVYIVVTKWRIAVSVFSILFWQKAVQISCKYRGNVDKVFMLDVISHIYSNRWSLYMTAINAKLSFSF